MALRQLLRSSLVLASCAVAQFPSTPVGITTKEVTSHPGISISYKQTKICESRAKAWAGYVHMPISYLQDIEGADPYNISMFFWYIEARENSKTAPTGIYLAGGPGESSLDGATQDGGPCYIGVDSNSTYTNEWSMNNHVNMLYIDQPVGTGYSYNSLVKSTLNLLQVELSATNTPIKAFEEYNGHVPPANSTFLHAILPSQNVLQTANTTGVAAVTLWNFAQVWFSEFPEYTTSNKLVSIWGNSWAGFFVTATGAYIQKQNVKIRSGEITGTIIHLDNIGFTNGCVDFLYQLEAYAELAFQNVYDYQVVNKTIYEELLDVWSKPKGCRDLLLQCRALEERYDPNEFAINKTVTAACIKAQNTCGILLTAYSTPSYTIHPPRSAFDMSHKLPDGYPTNYVQGFFSHQWVQEEMGVPVNFTVQSDLTSLIFVSLTADGIARAGMKDVEYLLDAGVKVTLIYGDRDYRCPWLGAENLSLAANWTEAEQFREAGYASIQTNKSYVGGVVRQHGNLSFSRVFQAGHDAWWYQPETVYQIFNRAIFNTDVATGRISTAGPNNGYSSKGPHNLQQIKEVLPPSPPVNCNLNAVTSSCTMDQLLALENGTAEVVEFNVIKPAGGGGIIPSGL